MTRLHPRLDARPAPLTLPRRPFPWDRATVVVLWLIGLWLACVLSAWEVGQWPGWPLARQVRR
jgi:hypothetical protein